MARQTVVVDLVTRLAGRAVDLLRVQPRVLVCIDGPDAAGKTTLADMLASAMTLPVIRASVDDFHHPREIRQRQGSLSPEGYYADTFDYDALIAQLLSPFTEGSSTVRTACFDYVGDHAVEPEPLAVPTEAVLVVDGVVLLRPELRDWWTVSVYLHVPPDVTLSRALLRDRDVFGSDEEVERRYRARYMPGQVAYRAEADPERAATIVIDNSTLETPVVTRWSAR